jgi:adenine-specific DNA-methyltransferase
MTKTVKFAESLLNLHQEKLEELKKLLPNLFDKDGSLIKSELENFTSSYVQEKSEPFVFSWAGKQKAKGLAFKQSETKLALKFDEKRSKNFDKTENLIIEGDNLHVLKLLLQSYKGKVKCIYIDPPYNTQSNFIYPDNFAESEKEYLLNSGQINVDGDLIINDRLETAGRKHSVWLSMIYPRLVLARELLREDGVIFVSIDDNEVHHLRQLMNEVFGEGEFVNQIIWYYSAMSSKPKNKLRNSAEYILVYAKDKSKFEIKSSKEDKMKNRNIADVVNKLAKAYGFTSDAGMKSLGYSFDSEANDYYSMYDKEVRDYFKNDIDSVLYVPVVNRMAKEYLKEFENQKPVALMKKLLQISTQPNDLIIDFFAGSGTTGQAVMELNQEEIDKKSKDGLLVNEEKEVGGRKFILVQLPEKIDEKKEAYKAGYRKISDITIERVKRAGEKYKYVDNGFKVMTVTESAVSRKLMNSITASEEEIFAEVALSYGYGLNFAVESLLDGVWKLSGSNRNAVVILGNEQLSNEAQKQIILLSDKLKDCQIFAQDACLNVEIIHNLYQHFEQRRVIIL